MKYYRDPSGGEVFAYETEGERDAFGAPQLVAMSAAEVEAHLAPVLTDQAPAKCTPLEFIERFTDDEQLISDDLLILRSTTLNVETTSA